MEEEKSTTIELDISLYLKKINIYCPLCIYNCECRGVTPVEPECPHGRYFVPAPEALK